MPSESFCLRDATVADIEAIVAVDNASFKQPWSRTSFEQAFADSRHSVVLVLERSGEKRATADATPEDTTPDGGEICGFGVAWSVADEGEIATLAIAPAERGQGLGERLVRVLTERLVARGAIQVFLEVRPSNTSARRLYEKLGFTEVGLRRNYYGDGESAIVMKWMLH